MTGTGLLAIITGDGLTLLSRYGYNRSAMLREPFRPLVDAGLPSMVLDDEIAAPDERGVTHIDALTEALAKRQPERLAYFAFDLFHLDGHDLRACAIEDRKALLRDVIGAAGCPRLMVVDHITGSGRQLFDAVRQLGAEGIVSKRVGRSYRGGPSRDWLKAKVGETAAFCRSAEHVFGQVCVDQEEWSPGERQGPHSDHVRTHAFAQTVCAKIEID
jgi:ATP-dependent DNA ligase